MKRRAFIQSGLAAGLGSRVLGVVKEDGFERAVEVLGKATADGLVRAAVLRVVEGKGAFTRAFGKAREDSMFLLGSISKPINVTALMTLFERGEFKLEDRAQKFLAGFKGEERKEVTMKQLLTHTSGLPDQLAENNELRRGHASLAEFAEHAMRAPLSFAPGTKYQYSSMGVLLATRVAELVSGKTILELTTEKVFGPLKMERSAQGLGKFKLEEMVSVQTEHAAPEAGGGDPSAKDWDWNSAWWRGLGAPWGATHCSAGDIGKWLGELLEERGACVKPETARLMKENQNGKGITPRGLGLALGSISKGCSERTFGHTGSTGTIAWADPATKRICVVLTSLPATAVKPHPRDLAGEAVASA
jgi:CubicO group peptidase (beta-lactamase class C family)